MSSIQYRPHDTDERLRTRLDANQVDRERMCQALLALDSRFHDVRPRHPRGGRDGGRDLEARLSDGRVVWASIGFRNMVSDSPVDLRWAKKKFSDDLKRALTEELAPDGFVFVTNVEFTMRERDTLTQKARKAGFRFVDVLHRERLRILLDGPDGLAVRYQYLGIPLSEAEQAAFFARWGNQLEELISQQFASVDRKLARIEFLQECGNSIRSLYVTIKLKRRVAAAELGRFLAVLSILDFDGSSPLLEIDLTVRNVVSGTIDREFQLLDSSMWISPGLLGEPDGEEDRNSPTGDPDEQKPDKIMVASSLMSVLS